MNNLTITELIDINCLKLMQNSFSEFSGVAVSTFDTEGNPLTQNKSGAEFCEKLVKCSETGLRLCNEFDKNNIIKAIDENKAVLRTCHAGLSCIVCPVYFNEKVIGSIYAGGFHTDDFNAETVRNNALDLGTDPDKLIDAVKETPYIPSEQITKIEKFLCEFSNILSAMAKYNYDKIKKNIKSERLARFQSERITSITKDLSSGMQEWLNNFITATDKYDNIPEIKYETDSLLAKAQEVYAVINGTADYIRMSDENAEYSESVYDVRKLIGKCMKSFENESWKNNVKVTLNIANALPEKLVGSSSRIGRIISKLGNDMIKNTMTGGELKISISNLNTTYSCTLIIEMTGIGSLISSEIIEKCKKIIKSGGVNIFKRENNTRSMGFDFPIIVLLTKQMSGKIKISNTYNENVNVIITIPQLDGTRKNA